MRARGGDSEMQDAIGSTKTMLTLDDNECVRMYQPVDIHNMYSKNV